MKTCSSCKNTKEIVDFYRISNSKNPRPECKVCSNKNNAEYVSKNKQKVNAYKVLWAKENPEKIAEANQKRDKSVYKYYCAKRRCAKLKATPNWLTNTQHNEIKQIYANCPNGYVVDHYEPLQGKEVCGLNVPWNLQYLTPLQNSIKGNKRSTN